MKLRHFASLVTNFGSLHSPNHRKTSGASLSSLSLTTRWFK